MNNLGTWTPRQSDLTNANIVSRSVLNLDHAVTVPFLPPLVSLPPESLPSFRVLIVAVIAACVRAQVSAFHQAKPAVTNFIVMGALKIGLVSCFLLSFAAILCRSVADEWAHFGPEQQALPARRRVCGTLHRPRDPSPAFSHSFRTR